MTFIFLSILCFFATGLSDSLFTYPLSPAGAYANALGLGGMDREPSAEALFYDPALLGNIARANASVSLNRIANDPRPSFAAAGRLSSFSVLGLGYRGVEVRGEEESQIFIASSFEPTPLFVPGASIKYLSLAGRMNLDLDLGFVWNPHERVRLGASIENALGSALDDDSRVHRAREVGSGIQYFWTRYGADGCLLSLRANQSLDQVAVGFGAEKRFLANPQIALRAGGYYAKESDSVSTGLTLGFLYRHDIREQRLTVEYGQRLSAEGAEKMEHFVTLSCGLYGGRDRIPPRIFVETNREYFTPDGDNLEDLLYFRIKAEDNPGGAGFSAWALMIAARDSTGRPAQVKAFVGGGIPPSTIAWDGRNSRGLLVARGTYLYMFTATDKNGNQSKTDWLAVEVK